MSIHTTVSVAETTPAPEDTAPARPFYFDGLAGWYHPGSGQTAVLVLGPWGYEELCARKSLRLLGEMLGARGCACLRFDYPATGHSAGDPARLDDSHAWRHAAAKALAELKRLSGATRIVIVGQGIGATLAADLAAGAGTGGEIAGLVLLAPVLQGRAALRELAAWTAMNRPTFLVSASDGPEGGLMAGGFVLSAATSAELKALNLLKLATPAGARVLLVERPGHPGDEKLAEHYETTGTALERLPFEGYEDYVSNPTLSVPPEATLTRVADWIGGLPASPAPQSVPETSPGATRLEAPVAGVSEDALRFGPDDMFYGVLARSADARPRATVLLLNAGYDHSIGWARAGVDLSRRIAAKGAAVLRMDLAGMGESRYWPGQAPQVLYSDRQIDDVRAAIDRLCAETGLETVVLTGRCSGAYLALLAAEADKRVSAAFLVNTRKLVWDPDEDVEKAVREPIQTLQSYGRKAFSRETVRRLLSGDLRLGTALTKVLRAAAGKLDLLLAPFGGVLSRHARLARRLRERLKTLEARGVPVALVYSENDRGVMDLDGWFGADRRGLAAHPNVTLHFVAGADHNLTPASARAEVETLFVDFLKRIG